MTHLPHHLQCEANICHDVHNKELTWYPGEKVCKKSPYLHFQKIQNRINKLLREGVLKYPDTYYNSVMLNKIKQVGRGIKGIPMNRILKRASRKQSGGRYA